MLPQSWKRRATAQKPRHSKEASTPNPSSRALDASQSHGCRRAHRAAARTCLAPRPSGAPCWAAAQTCPHPRAEIPRRCAAATATNAAAAASMEEPALTGARRRGAPQTRRSSRLLSCGITGARRRELRKRRADAAKHPRHTPAAALWTPRNRTAAAVLTGLPPGPALLPATPSGAPCRAAAQTCPHPRAEIPRRCAAATATNAAAAASMEEPALTGARRRGAPQTRRSSRLLSCGITGARRRRAPGARGSSRLQRGLRSGRATRGGCGSPCAAFASPLAPAPYRAGHIRSGALRRPGRPAAARLRTFAYSGGPLTH